MNIVHLIMKIVNTVQQYIPLLCMLTPPTSCMRRSPSFVSPLRKSTRYEEHQVQFDINQISLTIHTKPHCDGARKNSNDFTRSICACFRRVEVQRHSLHWDLCSFFSWNRTEIPHSVTFVFAFPRWNITVCQPILSIREICDRDFWTNFQKCCHLNWLQLFYKLVVFWVIWKASPRMWESSHESCCPGNY